MLPALIPALPSLRSESLDLRVVPHGFNCSWREVVDFSLHSGDARRPVNDHAFGVAQTRRAWVRDAETPLQDVVDTVRNQDPSAFMIYVIGESTNAWSQKALGNFADLFAAEFGTRRNESFPWMAEPLSHDDCLTFGDRTTLMEEQWLAYEDNYAIFPQIFVPAFVPARLLRKVLPWALRNRHADKAGYELDLAVVPLTGNVTHDYGEALWWSGRKWNVNRFAMRAATHYAPESKVRFYREDTAKRVEESGLVRYEWPSQSGVGNYDLSMGDPSITRLELSQGVLPVVEQQLMNFDFDFQYVVMDGNCRFTVTSSDGSTNVTTTMQPSEMLWVRAGVAHRIDAVPAGSLVKVMAVGGPWKPYVVEVLDDMVYNIFEDPEAQRVSDPKSFYRNAQFRTYLLSDTPWVHPEGFGDLVHKVWDKSTSNNDDVGYFAVKLQPHVWVPKHHHPTGAVYVLVDGSMHFPGEGTAKRFEARWTAPGHFYAGERADAERETLISVLGTDVGPQFTVGPPSTNYLEEHRTNLHVVYRDEAAAPLVASSSRLVGSGAVATLRHRTAAVLV